MTKNQANNIKKAAPVKEADNKNLQNNYNTYQLGYQDAAKFNWESLPIDMVFHLIDGYKTRALSMRSSYFNGLADGAFDAIKHKKVAA